MDVGFFAGPLSILVHGIPGLDVMFPKNPSSMGAMPVSLADLTCQGATRYGREIPHRSMDPHLLLQNGSAACFFFSEAHVFLYR